ncbi:hypothetical protein M441DRAFT_79428 [Trichoderma asperellum CBS 433.97]|uniref:Uncharacterized protein n=1 Tax=Trichoderma asperellum (strain ATCC 204424 / CBS 433.97 / NBRC 101777) TaxID=1042311 RepID=A0A2T3Z8W6_TRIA4|nr:hypothetical protein M441DRAFT_79428 [Trichoderma asperellum CBS 433.97]PTB41253.1 hypothetical protein M441DRAFT_79428 [Trichoderma asperellum CBS 433.97]
MPCKTWPVCEYVQVLHARARKCVSEARHRPATQSYVQASTRLQSRLPCLLTIHVSLATFGADGMMLLLHKGTASRVSSCPVPYHDDRHGSRATFVRSPLG